MKYRLRKTDEPVEVVAWETDEKGARNENDWVSYIDAQGNEHIKEHLTLEWDFVIESPFGKTLFETPKLPEFDLWEARRYELVKQLVIEKDYPTNVALSCADGIISALKKQKPINFYVPDGVDMSDPKSKIAVILGIYKKETGMPQEEYLSLLKALDEQKPVEWSEEDEMYLSQAIETLEHENYSILADKLKSLRPSWKPSEVCYGAKGDPDPAGVWKPSEEDERKRKMLIETIDSIENFPNKGVAIAYLEKQKPQDTVGSVSVEIRSNLQKDEVVRKTLIMLVDAGRISVTGAITNSDILDWLEKQKGEDVSEG